MAETREQATQWLLCVSSGCYQGECGDAFVAEIEAALRAPNSALTMFTIVYEPKRNAFHEIIGVTPRALINAGLYDALAIEWWEGPLQVASEQLIAQALGGARVRARERCMRNLCNALPARRSRVATGGLRSQTGLLVIPDNEAMQVAVGSRSVREVRQGATAVHDRL